MSYLDDEISKRGLSEIARALGVTRSAVWQWNNIAKKVPAKRVLDLERLTGIPRHKWRPDIYGKEPGPLERRHAVA